jgi:hypothetical protein
VDDTSPGGSTPPSGKGRPTPKRRDARKRRRATTPANRKEAAKLRRERLREQRQQQRDALRTGDERHLPARDAGPAKRLAREYVDSRFTVGQVFFGMIFVVLVLTLVRNTVVIAISNLLMLALFAGVLFDSLRVGRGARRAVEERYGAKEAAGVTSYALMRAMQPRRMRRPPARPREKKHAR